MIGRTLSHFEITAKLGEGGMGEVYRAEDTKLGREVALKILPETVAGDKERLARFDREARVVASLNHPAIAAIHSLEHDDGVHFIVMELAEGEDLAQRTARGRIPAEAALPIALQIAEALEFAHDRGVVHRDLKPANIMLGPGDRVKILDFGLAKALEGPGAGVAVDLSVSPTLTAQMTQEGVILGTAGYMSPEQARGSEVDKRADIWAFGVVLYEMLAGRRLFDGGSVTDVLAQVMLGDLDFERLPDDVPPAIRHLMSRCLDREEQTRLRDIGEARVRIAHVLEHPEESAVAAVETTPVPAQAGWKRLTPWLVAAGVGLVGLGLGTLIPGEPATSSLTVPIHVSVQLPEGVVLAGWSSPAVAFSPDESTIAFVGNRQGRQELYLRRLDEPEAVVVPDSDGAEGPFFSPDGRWVGFGAGAISGRSIEPRMLKRAPVDGGETQEITPLSDYIGGSWGTDGYIYYADAFIKGYFRRVRETGGEPEPLSIGGAGDPLAELTVAWPQYIDDGRYLLFTALKTRGNAAMLLDLESGELTEILEPVTFARYVPSGHLVFSTTDGTLHAAPFDPGAANGVEASLALVRDIAFTTGAAPVFAAGGSGSAIYATGFVSGSGRELSRLVRIDPKQGTVERLPFEPQAFLRGYSLHPDERRLAVATWSGSLWIYDLARGTRLKFPEGDLAGERLYPAWSPDGESIAYSVQDPDNGGTHVYVQAAEGTGTPRRLAGEPGEGYATDWTLDGREVIYSDLTGTYRRPASADQPPVKIDLPPGAFMATLSPDGRWLAYQSEETGRREVYVKPFAGDGAVIPVSSGGGQYPVWSATGDELYYTEGCNFFAVAVSSGPTLELGRTRTLFEHCDPTRRRGAAYDVDSEGRFYVFEAVPDSGSVTFLELVLGWSSEVEADLGSGSGD